MQTAGTWDGYKAKLIEMDEKKKNDKLLKSRNDLNKMTPLPPTATSDATSDAVVLRRAAIMNKVNVTSKNLVKSRAIRAKTSLVRREERVRLKKVKKAGENHALKEFRDAGGERNGSKRGRRVSRFF